MSRNCVIFSEVRTNTDLKNWNDYYVKYGLFATRDEILNKIIATINSYSSRKDSMSNILPVHNDSTINTPKKVVNTDEISMQGAVQFSNGNDIKGSSLSPEQNEKQLLKVMFEKVAKRSDAKRDIPKLDLIGGIFPRGDISFIIGASGNGKSTFAEYFAFEVGKPKESLLFEGKGKNNSPSSFCVDGKAFLNQQPQKVLYYVGEAGVDRMDRRLKQMRWTDYGNVTYIDAKAARRYEYKDSRITLDLDKPFGRDFFKHAISTYRPDIVFVDSLSLFFRSSLNEHEYLSVALSFLMDIAEEFTCAIVVIHHTRKRPGRDKNNPLSMEDGTGNGIINRFCAVMLTVEPMSDEMINKTVNPQSFNESQNWRIVNVVKDWDREARPLLAFYIRKTLYEHTNGTDMIINHNVETIKNEPHEQTFFEQLTDLEFADKVFTIKHVLQAFVTPETSDSTIRRRIRELIDIGKVKSHLNGKLTVYTIPEFWGNKEVTKDMADEAHGKKPKNN